MEKGIVIGSILLMIARTPPLLTNVHTNEMPTRGPSLTWAWRRNTEADYIFWTITFSDVLWTLPKLTLVGSIVMPICQSVLPVLSVRLRVS